MDGDKVLGRMFAAQIKCGTSYFKSKNEDGYVYHGKQKHLNLFINYSIPVILILCDPRTRRCIWREIDPRDTDETETGWEITVPFDQAFDASAKDRLTEMAGLATDYLPKLQQYWLGNKVLLHRDNKIVMLVVDRHEQIEKGDITDVLSALRRFRDTDKLTKKYKGRLEISVYGYESDPRELYEVPEVREWFKKLDREFPFWFYFLSKQLVGLKLITVSVCEYAVASGRKELDSSSFQKFLEDHFVAMHQLCESIGISKDEIDELVVEVSSYYHNDKED